MFDCIVLSKLSNFNYIPRLICRCFIWPPSVKLYPQCSYTFNLVYIFKFNIFNYMSGSIYEGQNPTFHTWYNFSHFQFKTLFKSHREVVGTLLRSWAQFSFFNVKLHSVSIIVIYYVRNPIVSNGATRVWTQSEILHFCCQLNSYHSAQSLQRNTKIPSSPKLK